MKYNAKVHKRRSIRLKEYDYSHQGMYFVTVCTHDKKCNLGKVMDDEMQLNKYGYLVRNEWIKTTDIRNNIELDSYIIMPNHLHGIIIINCRGVLQYVPTDTIGKFQSPSQTIGSIIRGFKSVVTKQINILRKTPGTPFWQRNYYEHIIRNEKKLNKNERIYNEQSIKMVIGQGKS